jgi:hypothetical protein
MHPGRKLLLMSLVIGLMAGVQGIVRSQTRQGKNDRVSGLYEGVAKMPGKGSHDLRFIAEIKNQNGNLSGHVELDRDQVPLAGNCSDDGAVTIKLKPGPELTITAKVSGSNGDQITGTWQMEGGGAGAIEMKRVSLEWKQVHDLIGQARSEVEQFTRAGGKAGDQNNPAASWANRLWEYSQQHPGKSESKDAANEALRLLLRARLIGEAAARISTLKSPDEAWQQALFDQLATAGRNKEYDYIVDNADSWIEHSKEVSLKVRIRLAQGEAYWEKGDTTSAKAVFGRVISENPNTGFADEARGDIYEIEKLNVGQPAPQFNSTLAAGQPARLADYKGKTVLLVFWASW